jgi:hypothetical protein
VPGDVLWGDVLLLVTFCGVTYCGVTFCGVTFCRDTPSSAYHSSTCSSLPLRLASGVLLHAGDLAVDAIIWEEFLGTSARKVASAQWH